MVDTVANLGIQSLLAWVTIGDAKSVSALELFLEVYYSTILALGNAPGSFLCTCSKIPSPNALL